MKATYKGELVRVLVKSTKNCRITRQMTDPIDTNVEPLVSELVPTTDLTFIDPIPEMVAAVKTHAAANYEKDGWDIVVESYTDDEIAKEITGSRDNAAAIRKMARIAKLHAGRREEVQAEAF